jgi:quercetin dioxygenase-like cupin family protein
MSSHVDDLLADYSSGALAADLIARVEDHLRRCNRCQRELHVLDEVYASLSLALVPVPPPAVLRRRILDAAERGGRFEALCARVAGMLDLAKEKARDLLAWIDDPARWGPGPAGAQLIHLPAGPATAGANCGFVRMAAGSQFPMHRHGGPEHVLVLQGGFTDDDGRVYHRGDEAQKPAGSEHLFDALPDCDLIYLVVLEGGLTIPSDPGFEL